MAAIIIEAPDVLQNSQSIPSQALNVCNNAPGWQGTGNCAGGKGLVGGPECDCDAGDKCNTIFNSNEEAMGALVSGFFSQVVIGDGMNGTSQGTYGLQGNPSKKTTRRKCLCN